MDATRRAMVSAWCALFNAPDSPAGLHDTSHRGKSCDKGDFSGETYVVAVGAETITPALSRHALQSVGSGPESYVVSFIEEQGLCIGTGAQGANCGHNNCVVAAVVLLLEFAVHPGQGLVQDGASERRRRVVDSGKFVGARARKLGRQVLVFSRKDVDGEPSFRA